MRSCTYFLIILLVVLYYHYFKYLLSSSDSYTFLIHTLTWKKVFPVGKKLAQLDVNKHVLLILNT